MAGFADRTWVYQEDRMITQYVTYDDVRAVLGVVDYELPDSVLSGPVFNYNLELKLSEVSGKLDGFTGTLAEHFVNLKAVSPRTTEQEKLYNLIGLYAVYVVASQAADSLSMFAKKTESDGKAVNTRFSSEATFKDVKAKMESLASSVLGLINDVLGNANSSNITTMLKVVVPSVDKVTNEAS